MSLNLGSVCILSLIFIFIYPFITNCIRFAIKTQLCPKDSEFTNVLREVRFLRTCRHPCIIDVHDAFLITNPR